jgi:hypothetical protein
MSDADELDPRWYGALINRDEWHFHRRLWKRYKIILAPGEFSWIKSQIKSGEAQVLIQKSPLEAIYAFKIASANRPVFVAAIGAHLKTALPPTKRLWKLRKAQKPK